MRARTARLYNKLKSNRSLIEVPLKTYAMCVCVCETFNACQVKNNLVDY